MIQLLVLLIFSSAWAFDQNHTKWDEVLDQYVVIEGKDSYFKYLDLKSNDEDYKKLKSYLNDLSKVNKKEYDAWDKDQKLAFLFNAYNAFTVELILRNHSKKKPLKSIKDIGSFFTNPWKKEFFTFLGEESHLDRIEHGIAREDFDRPKLHVAFNCASLGCPSLVKGAFVGEKLEEQLVKATKNFMNNPKKNRYDAASNTLYLSSIFKWYGEDFKKSKHYKDMYDFAATYMDLPEDQKKKIRSKKVDLEDVEYDWDLNDPPSK